MFLSIILTILIVVWTVRNRTSIKPIQARILRKFFQSNPFPTIDERYELAEKIELSIEVVSRWFRNRRWEYGRNQRNQIRNPF